MTTLILSVFFSIVASAYDVELDGIYYNLVPNGNVAEVTNGANKYEGDITIPSSIKVNDTEYSVTSVGNSAFEDCISLTSITIPNSVTSIDYYAFRNCSGLQSITIPNSVTIILDYAFSGCSSLTSIAIPNSVTSIGEGAFYKCLSLTSVTIPNSVTSIGREAFYGCSSLMSVTIPNSVKEISYLAFSECPKLENVYCYAESFSDISDNIFKDSYIEDATLHVPSSAISYYQTTAPWSKFGTIKALEDTGEETKKCETPTISFVDGKLTFSCATEGVE